MWREYQTTNPITRWTMTLAFTLVVLGGVASKAQGDDGSLERRRSPNLQVPTAPHGGVQAPAPGPHGSDVMPLPTPPHNPPRPRTPPSWSPSDDASTEATDSCFGSLWFGLLGLIRGRCE